MHKNCKPQNYWAAALLMTSTAVAAADAPAGMPAAPTTNTSKAHVDYFRGNIGHTGVAEETLAAPLSVLWRHTTAAAKSNPASPVFANATVYFPSAGAVYALNAADGTAQWQYPADGKAHASFGTTPALLAGALYVTDDNGQAYKLDAATGKELWTAKLEGAIRSAPVISGGAVYFGSGNNHCYALNADTGAVLWDQQTDGAITTPPTIAGGLVIFTSSDNNVYSLIAKTGKKAWSVPFDADPSVVPIVYNGTTLYVSAGDTLYGLDPRNGNRRSTLKLPTIIQSPPTISGDSLYTTTQSNILYGLSLTGQKRWQTTLDSGSTAPPLLAGNMLLVATQSGVLSGYDSATGKLTWRYVMQASATDSQPKYPSASVYAAPIVANGTLYVVSDDGSLTAFRQDAPDHIAPDVVQILPEAGATVRSEGARNLGLTYGALLVDDGTGIDPASVSLQVDGQVDAQALYHAGENAIYNTPTEPLKEGQHSLTLTARDWRGNSTSQTWSFTVNDQGPGGFGNPFPGSPTFPGTPGRPSTRTRPGAGNGGRNPAAPPPPPPIAPF